MATHAIYLERDDERHAPPSTLLEVAFSPAGYVGGDPSGTPMDATVFLAIGSYEEGTYERKFVTSEDQTFAVKLDDLVAALIGLGALRVQKNC